MGFWGWDGPLGCSLAVALLVWTAAGCDEGETSTPSGSGGQAGMVGSGGTAASSAGGSGAASTGGSGGSGNSGGGSPSSGAQLLYDGPVGGQLAGWDHAAPWPMVAMGQSSDTWLLTLLDVAPDGTLGNNVANRVVVWGWPPGTVGAPATLYDGPVGGVLPGWDSDGPIPLVAMGGPASPATWQMTLLQLESDGTLTANVAERVVLWGWASADPGAPSIRYDGAVGGQLAGWSSGTPEPLVAGGEATALDSWWMTLCSLGPDGTIGDNLSNRIVLWGW